MHDSHALPRRRRWPVVLPLAIVIALALAWSAVWFFAARSAEAEIAAWREREAAAGRIYRCGSESVGGYPFRIEVRCADAGAELTGVATPLSFRLADILVAAQVYDPSLLIGEFQGPLTVAEPGRPPTVIASWKLAQASVRGTPAAPQRLSVVLEAPRFDRIVGATQQTFLAAARTELHGRLAGGTAEANPVVDIAVKLTDALAPALHPLTAQTFNLDGAVTLRGMKDFAPKPWPERLRELQANGGRLDITSLRAAQGDMLAAGAGTLSLTATGGLEGELQLTVAGIDQLLAALQIEKAIQEPGGRLGAALGMLDRVSPGLANFARQNAGTAISAGVRMLGQPTKLDGRDAVALPLRFSDGAVFLGPLAVGRVPPLFQP